MSGHCPDCGSVLCICEADEGETDFLSLNTWKSPTRMTEVDQFQSDLFDRAEAISHGKRADYCGDQNDPLWNVGLAETLGIVDTAERGLLVRISDKLARLISLLDNDPQVKDESFEDTVVDAINYLVFLAYKRKERQK